MLLKYVTIDFSTFAFLTAKLFDAFLLRAGSNPVGMKRPTLKWPIIKPWIEAHHIPKLDDSYVVSVKCA